MADAATRIPARASADDFPCFDGLRAIAALLVAVTHAGFVSGFNLKSDWLGPLTARMDIGVAIFFVVSGFLLYRPFVVARLTGGEPPRLLAYGRRRALRIFPAYWVALGVMWAVPAIRWNNVASVSTNDWLAHASLIHTYDLRFGLIPLQQAWTLVTEIAFYAMLPIYAALLARFDGEQSARMRHQLIGVAALFAAGLMFRTAVLFGIDHDGWRGTINLWLPPRLDHFALGMALAVLSVWQRDCGHDLAWTRNRWLPAASWTISAATFGFIAFGMGLQEFRGQGFYSLAQEWWLLFLWGIVGVTAVAPAVLGPQRDGAVRGLLQWRPLAFLGTISYGIYLWHEAALDFLIRWQDLEFGGLIRPFGMMRVSGFMFAVTIPIAIASYYIIERPALTLKNRPISQWLRRTPGVRP